jgi:hypothetical protein
LKDSVHAPSGCCRSPASPACRRSRCRLPRWEAAHEGSRGAVQVRALDRWP